jgi:hypothetical protein
MTILISHRGNIEGSIPEKENTFEYVRAAIDEGYDVEVDIWLIRKMGKLQFMLGHDKPKESIHESFLFEPKLWFHCKNIEAMLGIQKLREKGASHLNYFFHRQDDCTLTSQGYFWTYPGKLLTPHSIAVLPENVGRWKNVKKAAGICSDFIGRYDS